MEFDEDNGNTRWKDAEALEIGQIDDYKTFLNKGKGHDPGPDYKKIKVHFDRTLDGILVGDDPAPGARLALVSIHAHELAHMWFGDLVTMAWWNDLWLNEAFATWMAFHVVDAWKPEWRMWLDFQHHRSAALGMDALRHTHPIYTEVRSPAEATENFDLITYEKGAAVVRMLERWLGAPAFRRRGAERVFVGVVTETLFHNEVIRLQHARHVDTCGHVAGFSAA